MLLKAGALHTHLYRSYLAITNNYSIFLELDLEIRKKQIKKMKKVKMNKLKNLFKRKKVTMEENNQLIKHENDKPGTQTCHNLGLTDRDPGADNHDTKPNGDQVLYIIKDILMGDRRAPELEEASEKLKVRVQQNGGCLKEYFKAVEQFLEENFPTLPNKPHLEPKEFLEGARRVMCKLIGSVPILEDLGLLRVLLGSYNQRLYCMLDILLDRNSSVHSSLFIIQWVNETYFRHECKGCSNTESCRAVRLSDPLVLTAWLEKAKQKVLTLAQDYISATLQKILHSEVRDYGSEESFISLQLDVIQFLNAFIEANMEVSQTLGGAVQELCSTEFHGFAKKYVNAEKKHLKKRPRSTDLLYLYRTIFTCEKLRSFAKNKLGSINNTNQSTLQMFEDMEKQALFSAQQLFTDISQDHLKKYFCYQSIINLRDTIRDTLTALPEIGEADETKQRIVNVAFQSINRAYLHCLRQTKYSKLESIWGNMCNRLIQDAELLQSSFTQLSGSHAQNMFLLKISEIVSCSDVEPLKIVCTSLYIDFPKESKEYLHVLLRWRGLWTRRQINEVLNMSREVYQNGEHVGPHYLKFLTCGLCCT